MRIPAATIPICRVLAVAAFAIAPGCTCTDVAPAAPAITSPWSDDFDRSTLGPDWKATDESAYKLENGELVVQKAHNHPVWLTRALPRDAKIEFDAWSNDEAGDIKVEVWGDGKAYATDLYGQYTSTSYNVIFGGWHNQLAVLARLNEHGDDRKARADVKVEKGRHYHFTITRKGAKLDWQLDGQPFLSFEDPAPLEGPGHAYFGITDWEAELHFDHLRISPL